MERILIIKPSSLGDVVHTLPLAHALKRCNPDCELGWIVHEAFAELLERDPAVDCVYPIRISSTSDPQAHHSAYLRACIETFTTLRTLREQIAYSFDMVLDLHASFRSGLLGLTAAGAQRIGFTDARELNTLFQHRVVKIPVDTEHALEKNLLFAHHLGCPPVQEDFTLHCNQKDRDYVSDFLKSHGIRQNQQVIYANPAARWATKFWPTERWAELADKLYAKGKILLFGGSTHDKAYIQEITSQMQSKPFVSAGYCSLPQTVALLKASRLYVGLDSGPMHMAALASVPVVALFGPTHPSRVGPYNVANKIIRAEGLDCLECRKRSCNHVSCMKNLSVEMVLSALVTLLDETE